MRSLPRRGRTLTRSPPSCGPPLRRARSAASWSRDVRGSADPFATTGAILNW